ncbi:hypothetical protein Q604_UNBC05806G0001, partial [human gut metagenome]
RSSDLAASGHDDAGDNGDRRDEGKDDKEEGRGVHAPIMAYLAGSARDAGRPQPAVGMLQRRRTTCRAA